MVLVDSIKKSFGCIIKNPSITVIFVSFLIASNVLAWFILSSRILILAQILILCLFACIFVFFAGWFRVIKESVDIEKIKEKNFYSLFLEGVGEGVIPVTISIILYIFFVFITVLMAQFVAMKVFGSIDFFFDGMRQVQDASKLSYETPKFAEYFNSLDVNQKYIIYGWNFCIMAFLGVLNFLSLFYFPSLISSDKNIFLRPFISIWEGLKFLFKNFFSAIALTLFIYVINMILAFLNALFAQNFVISFVLLLIYIYFISYVVMLIFNYYEAKNNSSDRTDSIGENETVNTDSENN